jgi:hypothetical protein
MAASPVDVAERILEKNFPELADELRGKLDIAVAATVLKFHMDNGLGMDDHPVVETAYEEFVAELPENLLESWVVNRKFGDAFHEMLCDKWSADPKGAENKEELIKKRKELTRLFFRQKELYEENRYKNRSEIKEIKITWLRIYREFLTELDGYESKDEIVDSKRLGQMAASANYFNNDVHGKDFTR